jgi:hypothetical protein
MRFTKHALGCFAGVATCTVALSGCVTNETLRAQLEKRATYDLACNNLTLTPLEERGTTWTSYGVAGCGQRATYVLQPSTGTWVMNVVSNPEGQADIAPAAVPATAPNAPQRSTPASDQR